MICPHRLFVSMRAPTECEISDYCLFPPECQTFPVFMETKTPGMDQE